MNKKESQFHASYFELENQVALENLTLRYSTYGTLNSSKSNVIWVFHALTGSSEIEKWWGRAIGTGRILDPNKYFIVCVNSIGSPYGSTYPLSINPKTGKKYYHSFPQFTNRDIARSIDLLRQSLDISSIKVGMGASLGGQQLLEYAIMFPKIMEKIAVFCSSAKSSPWLIALNESQRMAIEADSTWKNNADDAGMAGMKVARSIALLSYRGYDIYKKTQETPGDPTDNFRASTYQQYQGEKLQKRFNAFSYWYLTKAMDSHNIKRERGREMSEILSEITAEALIVSIKNDLLFPVSEQEYLAKHIRKAKHFIFHSVYGHDAFLAEVPLYEKEVIQFIEGDL